MVVQGSAIATVDKLKIKKDYVPKALRAVAASSSSSSNNHNSGFTREQSPGALSVAHSDTSDSHHKRKKKHAGAGSTGQICPRCGETIPHDQLEQHMRIELLDPKWREQREKEIEWKRTKNLDDAGGLPCGRALKTRRKIGLNCFCSNSSGGKGVDKYQRVPDGHFRRKRGGQRQAKSEFFLCAPLFFSLKPRIPTECSLPTPSLSQLKEIEAKMAAKESRAWDGHTATARTVADNLYSSLTPEERERDFLRRRGQLIEGTIVGVQAPEGFSDRRPFEQRQFHQGQMPIQQQQQQQQQQRGGEEYPEWFRDPSQMLAQQQADASAYYSYYGANAAGAGATAGSPDETGYAAYDASWYSGEAFQGMAEQKEEETS